MFAALSREKEQQAARQAEIASWPKRSIVPGTVLLLGGALAVPALSIIAFWQLGMFAPANVVVALVIGLLIEASLWVVGLLLVSGMVWMMVTLLRRRARRRSLVKRP